MDRSKWGKKSLGAKSKPHRPHKAKYSILIGIRHGKKKFEYIDGHRFYGCMLAKMHEMAMEKCDYYRMEVHRCDNGEGDLFKLLAKVNRNRGDETDSEK